MTGITAIPALSMHLQLKAMQTGIHFQSGSLEA
jgi:hypothetical protein